MKQKLRINTSITDFAPLFNTLEYVFKDLKATEVDGVELVMGIKSRWSVPYLKRLIQTYKLPIISLHQPIWSGLNWYFDEGFLRVAKQLHVKHIVFHPLSRISIDDERMQSYFSKIATMQKKYQFTAMIENLPYEYNYGFVEKLIPAHQSTTDVQKLFAEAEKYDFTLTLDIDHLHKTEPHKEVWFKHVLPRISNIHLSSFDKTRKHLPLYMGEFKAQEFVSYLMENNYKGLLTFEICYPDLINPFGYNFAAVKKSVELLRSVK